MSHHPVPAGTIYGHWYVHGFSEVRRMAAGRDPKSRRPITRNNYYYDCECLLCYSMHKINIATLKSGTSTRCMSCASIPKGRKTAALRAARGWSRVTRPRGKLPTVTRYDIDRGLRYAQLWFCYRMFRCGLDLDRLVWGSYPAKSGGYALA